MLSELPGRHPDGRAVVVYSSLRLGLFVGAVALGALAGLHGLLLFVIALVVSGVLSWFLLAGPRARMSAAVDARASRWRERQRARTAAEDQYVDELMADQGVTRSDR